jgi:hypothetical protein
MTAQQLEAGDASDGCSSSTDVNPPVYTQYDGGNALALSPLAVTQDEGGNTLPVVLPPGPPLAPAVTQDERGNILVLPPPAMTQNKKG